MNMNKKSERSKEIGRYIFIGTLVFIISILIVYCVAYTVVDKEINAQKLALENERLNYQDVVYEILDDQKSISLSEEQIAKMLIYDYDNNETSFIKNKPQYLRTINNEEGYKNYNNFIDKPVVLRRDNTKQLYIEIEPKRYKKVESEFDDGNWIRLDQAFNGNKELDNFINKDIIRYKKGDSFYKIDNSYFFYSVKLLSTGKYHMKVIVNVNSKKYGKAYEEILSLDQYPANTWKDVTQIFDGNEQLNNMLNNEIMWCGEVYDKESEMFFKPIKLIAVGKAHARISYIENDKVVERTIPFELYPQKYWKPIDQIFDGNKKLDYLVGKDIISCRYTKSNSFKYMSRPIRLHAVGKDFAKISYSDPFTPSITIEEVIRFTDYPEDLWMDFSEAFNGNEKLDNLLNKEIIISGKISTLCSVGDIHAKISYKENDQVKEKIIIIDKYPEKTWVEFTDNFDGNKKLDHLVNKEIVFDLQEESKKTYGPLTLLEVGENYMKVRINKKGEFVEEILSLSTFPAEGWKLSE